MPARCPISYFETSGPSFSMRPTASCPRTRGNFSPGKVPSTAAESVWLTPQASTRMRTCPSPGCGTGRSTTWRLPGNATSTALYVVGIYAALIAGDSSQLVWIEDDC
jgi:hypothetical protein